MNHSGSPRHAPSSPIIGSHAWSRGASESADGSGSNSASGSGGAYSYGSGSGASVRRNHTISAAGGRIAARSEQRERQRSEVRLRSHFEQPGDVAEQHAHPLPQHPLTSPRAADMPAGLRSVWDRADERHEHGDASHASAAKAGITEEEQERELEALYERATVQRNRSMPNRTAGSGKPRFASLRHHPLPDFGASASGADSAAGAPPDEAQRYAFVDDDDALDPAQAQAQAHKRFSSQPNGYAAPPAGGAAAGAGAGAGDDGWADAAAAAPLSPAAVGGTTGAPSGIGSPPLMSPISAGPHASSEQLPISGLDRGPFGQHRAASPSLAGSTAANGGGATGLRRHQSLSYRSSHGSLGSARTNAVGYTSLASRFSGAGSGAAAGGPPSSPGAGASSSASAAALAAGLKMPMRSSTLDARPGSAEQQSQQRYGAPSSPQLGHSPLTPTHTSATAPWLIDEQPGSASSIRASPTAARFSAAAVASVARDLAGVSLGGSGASDDGHRRSLSQSQGPAPVAQGASPLLPGAASPSLAGKNAGPAQLRKLPSLITDRDALAARVVGASGGAGGGGGGGAGGAPARPLAGPFSASPYVPQIGHAHSRTDSSASPVVYVPRSERALLALDVHPVGGLSSLRSAIPGANNAGAPPLPLAANGTANGAGSGPGAAVTGAHARANRARMASGGAAVGAHADASLPLAGPYTALPASQSDSFRWPPPHAHAHTQPAGASSPSRPSSTGHTSVESNGHADAEQESDAAAAAAQQERTPTGNDTVSAHQQQHFAAQQHMDAPQMNGAPFGAQYPQLAGFAHMQAPQGFSPHMMPHMLPHLNGRMPFQQQAPQQPQQPQLGMAPLPGMEKIPPGITMEANRLVAQRRFNPPDFPYMRPPPGSRFFVIKSFTEDDVHRSLKHEIWASTEKGNARLDRAFRETKKLPPAPAPAPGAEADLASQGPPIYLFYSVNASGHFCGMAEMLSPLDYNTTSNVWAQEDKWKGIFNVRWVYVKDLPNNQLRHLRLTNTTEQKPVTQSRDTQELPANVGAEMLRIMAEFPAKTSLLQDFAFYEMQALQNEAQKAAAAAAAAGGPLPGTPGLAPAPMPGPTASAPYFSSGPPLPGLAPPFFGSDPNASLRYQQQLQNLFVNHVPPLQHFDGAMHGHSPYAMHRGLHVPSPQPSPRLPHA